MIERAARAIQTELRRQGVLYEVDEDGEGGEDLTRLMMSTGAAADLQAVVRAVFSAMREPTPEMLEGAWTETLAIVKEEVGDDKDLLFADRPEVESGAIRKHRAMIDAALSAPT